MDTGKAGRYVGCCSRELVIVGPCRHFGDSSAASVPQRRVHILKNEQLFRNPVMEELPTIRELSSWINTAPLARIYPFGWQGASATVVNVKSPNRFEVGATNGVVQVSRGVLHLESVPGPVWDAESVRHIIGGLVVAGHRFRGRPSEVLAQWLL